MSEKDKACREAFEAWAVDESWTVDWAGNDPYDHGRTMDAWEAFQAAWSRRAPEWQPIETAPKVNGDFFFCSLAWGPDCDKSTGQGFRWNGRWFAGAVFHRIGQERRFEIREFEVKPTHWMPPPAAPQPLSEEKP